MKCVLLFLSCVLAWSSAQIGPKGDPGLIGPPGAPGRPGDDGRQGVQGITGLDGRPGAPGEKGQSGSSPVGLSYGLFGHGPAGPDGPLGRNGPQGAPGATGFIGPQGFPGSPGIDGESGEPGAAGPAASPPGGVFTHWGASSCVNNEMVYSGLMSSSVHNDTGGASNYLCMPNEASYGIPVLDALESGSGTVAAVEFNSSTLTIPCSVCFIPRSTILMIPARSTCPQRWTTEYTGYLMSQTTSQERTEFVCVQAQTSTVVITDDETGAGGQAHFVEVDCGYGFNCDVDSDSSYESNRELSCVVCSR